MSVTNVSSTAPVDDRRADDEAGSVRTHLKLVDNEQRQFVTELFERYRAGLLRYLVDLLGSRVEAEDVLQEAYARVLDVRDLDRSGTRARAYLYKVATNLAYDHFRHSRVRSRHDSLDAVELESDAPSPERIVAFDQGLAAVKQVLLDLTPRCRRVFLLRVAEQLRYEDIAEELGISKRTVEREMRHALEVCQEKLRKSMTP